MNRFIPYGKHSVSSEDLKEVNDVLSSDWIISGPKVAEFEDAVAKYCGVKYGIAVSSGTAALDIAIQALNLPAGSEIITTPFTFIATINSILFNNLTPILVDILPDTYNIDPQSIRKKITANTRAILYVNYAGQPCDIKNIQQIAREHNLFLIEDSAQALGAEYNGRKIGGFADLTILSFHPVKHITTGEGGMVITNDKYFNEKLKILRNHGINKEARERLGPNADWSYDITSLARNYRITDFQAALGLSQLKKLEYFLKRRREIAQKYDQELQNCSNIVTPVVRSEVQSAWHLYPILIQNYDRNLLFRKMREKGIGVNVHHIPPYHFTYHQRFGWKAEDYPVTESVFRRTLTLSIYPSLTEEEQDYIIQTIKEILK